MVVTEYRNNDKPVEIVLRVRRLFSKFLLNHRHRLRDSLTVFTQP